MALLDSVSQHGTVNFSKNVFPNFNDHVRPNSKDMGVKSRMVDLAQGQSVHHGSDATLVAVRHDVGCVQQFFMSE